MASTMFVTEVSTSAFMGTAMPNSAAVSGKARVTMGFSKVELQRKPLSLIRTLARQRGIPISTKHQMINLLAGSSTTYSSSPSYSFSAPRPSSAASSASEGEYASKTLGELRALAKARGLRGDTRAEIIALLKSSPAGGSSSFDSYSSSSSSSFSAPSYPAAEAPKGLPKAVLERKSLAELRAMARIRGLRGDTKAELVKLLADNESAGGQVLAAPSYSAPSYSSSSNGSYSSSSNGAPKSNAATVKQLSLKSLSQLRAMAAIRGIRGATKDELVRQLALA